MIPAFEDPCWRALVTGERHLQTRQLGLQLMLKRCTTAFRPTSTPGEIDQAARQLHAFFVRYERVLPQEIAQLAP